LRLYSRRSLHSNGEALVNQVLFAPRDHYGWPRFDMLPE
jgi:hypothetical protein